MPLSKPRRRLSAPDRKDAIARAALPLFARQGLHGVTTRELAAACGVSEALIFRHFPTKEALFNQMLHYYGDEDTPRKIERRVAPSTTALVQFVFTFVRRVVIYEPRAEHKKMHFFYRSFTEDGKFARQFLSDVTNLRKYFEICVEEAREAGDAHSLATPPYNLFWFTQHVATAACMIRLPAKPVVRYQGAIEDAVEQMVLFILRGIGLTDAALAKYATPAVFAAWRAQGH
jgi:AcrR family transcriptional regulator